MCLAETYLKGSFENFSELITLSAIFWSQLRGVAFFTAFAVFCEDALVCIKLKMC